MLLSSQTPRTQIAEAPFRPPAGRFTAWGEHITLTCEKASRTARAKLARSSLPDTSDRWRELAEHPRRNPHPNVALCR